MIRQGQKIATVGSSGTATDLMFISKCWKNGRPVNPMPYLVPAQGNSWRSPLLVSR